MYFRPVFRTVSTSCSACSIEPHTAGTAVITCLPWLSTSMQCLAWFGASVATKTASIFGSLTSTSSDSYDFSQRHACISPARRSAIRSLTATISTFGWSWKPKAAPNWQTP